LTRAWRESNFYHSRPAR